VAFDRWTTWRRDVATAAACAALGLAGMRGHRVPLLGLVDLGFHELGHLVCYLLSVGALVTAAAGSVMQVAVPLGLAAYFLVVRRDRAGGAVCLAWAATAAVDASRYIADAPFERLELLGGEHDWAFFFGPDGIDAMSRAAGTARTVAALGWIALAASFVVALWPLVAEAVRGDQVPSRVGHGRSVSSRPPGGRNMPG
jgi:NADPH:quinone reductase-like Zn-dependent oxidoreductase